MSTTAANLPTNDNTLVPDVHPPEKAPIPLTPLTAAAPLDGRHSHKQISDSRRTFIVDLTADTPLKEHDVRSTSDEGQTLDPSEPLPPTLLESLSLLSIDHDVSALGSAAPKSGADNILASISSIDPPGLHPTSTSNGLAHATSADSEGEKLLAVANSQLLDDIDLSIPRREDLSAFSLSGLPLLETFIPDDLLPDDLLVHDIDDITHLCPTDNERGVPVRYVRIYPKASRESGEARYAYYDRNASAPLRIAHLYLKDENHLSCGHHSCVYRAPFKLRLDPESDEWSTASVVVKTAVDECGAHAMLETEAAVYNAFPRRLMEDHVSPAATSSEELESATSYGSHGALQPGLGHGSSTASDPADSVEGPISDDERTSKSNSSAAAPPGRLEPAVVPKFFGYYSAVYPDGRSRGDLHAGCDEHDACDVLWPTRLLVMEECGSRLERDRYTEEQRSEFLTLYRRLHAAGFTTGSAFRRNMLVQPGPLSVPRAERSANTPSFRLIDFGRAQILSLLSESDKSSFDCASEEEDVRRVLRLPL